MRSDLGIEVSNERDPDHRRAANDLPMPRINVNQKRAVDMKAGRPHQQLRVKRQGGEEGIDPVDDMFAIDISMPVKIMPVAKYHMPQQ